MEKMSGPEITHVGRKLELSTPNNKPVGVLIQTSPDAPDTIVYQPADGGPRVPWTRYIDDAGLFRVESGEISGQYVYEEAEVLKYKLNALATDNKYLSAWHGLKYWSGRLR
jgi:hypothetical protein